MRLKPLLFAAVFGFASLAGAASQTTATAAVAMTRVAQEPGCVAACQAVLQAEDARCLAMDQAGGFRGGLYHPCAAYARYQYNNCVAACPA